MRDAVVTLTGLRHACQQINEGNVIRLAGVMGIVSRSGRVAAGHTIDVGLPPLPHLPLTRV
jgi:MOSC domain-containing protein YiiM